MSSGPRQPRVGPDLPVPQLASPRGGVADACWRSCTTTFPPHPRRMNCPGATARIHVKCTAVGFPAGCALGINVERMVNVCTRGGISKLMAFAALRLITSSNLVGWMRGPCATGRTRDFRRDGARRGAQTGLTRRYPARVRSGSSTVMLRARISRPLLRAKADAAGPCRGPPARARLARVVDVRLLFR